MPLGSQTDFFNGQRFTMPTKNQYNPTAYGVQTSGVPQVSPTMPPYLGSGAAAGSGGSAENVGGYGTAGNNSQVAAIAAANPYSLKVSPVWWTVIALAGGLALLNVIHWRTTTLESVHVDGHAGAARADAAESV